MGKDDFKKCPDKICKSIQEENMKDAIGEIQYAGNAWWTPKFIEAGAVLPKLTTKPKPKEECSSTERARTRWNRLRKSKRTSGTVKTFNKKKGKYDRR